jgi:hypothetical protein
MQPEHQSFNPFISTKKNAIVAGAAQEILQDFCISTRINIDERRAIRQFLCVLVSSFLATVVSRYNKSTALNHGIFLTVFSDLTLSPCGALATFFLTAVGLIQPTKEVGRLRQRKDDSGDVTAAREGRRHEKTATFYHPLPPTIRGKCLQSPMMT